MYKSHRGGGPCFRYSTHRDERPAKLLCPVLFFLLRSYIQFDRVETYDLKSCAAVRALDHVSFISLLVHLNFGITFRTGSSWHLFIPP